MTTMLHLIRHAQASFGAADYDNLSELGHRQSVALGRALLQQGVDPGAIFIGSQKRHRQTWEGIAEGMGLSRVPTVLPGLNEFDFHGLLDVRYATRDDRPDTLNSDRRTHFRALRDTVLEWQRGEIEGPPEAFPDFLARVRAARAAIADSGSAVALAVSSGGAIGMTVADVVSAPADQMITLQLQVKNCAVARILLTANAPYLHGFNETPHITAENESEMLTYS